MAIKLNLKNIFFIFLFAVGTIANTSGLPGENKLVRIAMVIGGTLALAKLNVSSYTKKEIYTYIFLFVTAMLIYIKSKEISPLVTVMLLFFSKGIEFDKLITWTLAIKLIVISVLTIMLLTGIRQDNIELFWRAGTFIERHTFGFVTANAIQIQYAFIVSLILYKYFDSVKFIHILIMGVINQVLYHYTQSRTSYIVMIVIFILFLLKKSRYFEKIILQLAYYLLPLLMLISYVSMIYMGKLSLLNKLDELLTGRLYYCKKMYEFAGISLFGANMKDTGILFDNSYVRILTNLGLIYAIFIFYFMYRITISVAKERNLKLLFLIITFQLMGFTESVYGYIFSNITLFLITDLFRSRKEITQNDNSIHTNIQQKV